MAFTEFYCQTTASNLNAGSTTADAASLTYTSAVITGGWDSTTGIFTVLTGNPSSDGVAVGDFASVYVTSGATVATFIGRVTARDATTITVSLTAKSGTAPATDALGGTTLKIGGAWKGPNGTVSFPFGFVSTAMMNSGGDTPRVNFKNGTDYAVTAAMTHNVAGPVAFQGYTASAGDGGRATINGGSASSYRVLRIGSAGTDTSFADFIFTNPKTDTGSPSNLVMADSAGARFERCVFHTCRNTGLEAKEPRAQVIDCEAYACNAANNSSYGGFFVTTGDVVRCISHDNGTSAGFGFKSNGYSTGPHFVDCIADSNGGPGLLSYGSTLLVQGCDFYNNSGAGIEIHDGCNITIENSNFIKNGTYAIYGNSTGNQVGSVTNCGFGTGTAANSSGTGSTTWKPLQEIGSVTYGTDLLPWVDAPNGDFRINLAAAKGAGRGTFTQTAASYAGAIGYPDIGSNQHQDAGGSGWQKTLLQNIGTY